MRGAVRGRWFDARLVRWRRRFFFFDFADRHAGRSRRLPRYASVGYEILHVGAYLFLVLL